MMNEQPNKSRRCWTHHEPVTATGLSYCTLVNLEKRGLLRRCLVGVNVACYTNASVQSLCGADGRRQEALGLSIGWYEEKTNERHQDGATVRRWPASDFAEQFRAARRQAALDYAGPIAADGQLHRFEPSGESEPEGRYVLQAGSPPAGGFGHWNMTTWETRCERGKNASATDLAAARRRIAETSAKRDVADAAKHADARQAVANLLAEAWPCSADHSYLVAKGVRPHGDLREQEGKLALESRWSTKGRV